MAFPPVWGGIFHLTLPKSEMTFHFARIDARIVLLYHFGADDLHLAFGSDLIAFFFWYANGVHVTVVEL